MSGSLGVFDAKAQFSRLVDQAERGEETVITRHGRPVAKLVPVTAVCDADEVERILAEAKALREDIAAKFGTFSQAEIRDLRDEGRR
jgi:prevent-host-death family protein